MGQQSIEQLEQDIEITLALLGGELTRWQWNFYIKQYHALSIKWFQLQGKRPPVSHGQTDYII